jgi:hypothetical protein
MQEALDESPERGEAGAASAPLDAEDEPVLGPFGQKLLIAWVVLLALLFLVSSAWLLGYLAYTSPPIPPGGG